MRQSAYGRPPQIGVSRLRQLLTAREIGTCVNSTRSQPWTGREADDTTRPIPVAPVGRHRRPPVSVPAPRSPEPGYDSAECATVVLQRIPVAKGTERVPLPDQSRQAIRNAPGEITEATYPAARRGRHAPPPAPGVRAVPRRPSDLQAYAPTPRRTSRPPDRVGTPGPRHDLSAWSPPAPAPSSTLVQ